MAHRQSLFVGDSSFFEVINFAIVFLRQLKKHRFLSVCKRLEVYSLCYGVCAGFLLAEACENSVFVYRER